MTASTTYISFLIRLWREGSPEPSDRTAAWQGEVEHIQTSRRWRFSTLDELLGFLRWQVEDPEVLERSASEPRFAANVGTAPKPETIGFGQRNKATCAVDAGGFLFGGGCGSRHVVQQAGITNTTSGLFMTLSDRGHR